VAVRRKSEAAAAERQPDLVIITGLSGAGRSEAIHTFEDAGYFCIDNLPPSFIGHLVELTKLAGSRIRDVAVVCDVRGLDFFDELWGELEGLEHDGVAFRMLFLEADDDVLVQRFKETRRRHPLVSGGSVLEGITAEREALEIFRGRADMIIDTSAMRPAKLRERILEDFLSASRVTPVTLSVMSFGFKYGVPIDADIIMDVRFLPNPYYDPKLRPMTGRHEPVREFVLGESATKTFMKRWKALLEAVLPGYMAEGKHHLSIALGCTGGRHRSVVLAVETADFLRGLGYRVSVDHRDISKNGDEE
jgi:RNase adapter protein RapZ